MRTEPLFEAVKTFGTLPQIVMFMEEAAELTQALSKNIRGKDNRSDIIEEMADVLIMVEQIKIIFEVDEKEIQDIIEVKLKRIEERIKSHEQRQGN